MLTLLLSSGGPFQTLGSDFATLCNQVCLSIWGCSVCQSLGKLQYFHLTDMSANSLFFLFLCLPLPLYGNQESESRVKKKISFSLIVYSQQTSIRQSTILQFQWHRKEIGTSLNVIHLITKNLRNDWNGLNSIKTKCLMNFMKPVLSGFLFFQALENLREKQQFALTNS